jgi:MinD superfamily P-loop ATPase
VGCNVISSLTGADQALIVTEPSLSGLHDLRRVLDVAARLVSRIHVIINKADISPKQRDAIRAECRERSVDIVAEIPFDESVPRHISRRIIPSRGADGYFAGSRWRQAVKTITEI